MRISDWSSDVCSSDLLARGDRHRERAQRRADEGQRRNGRARGKRKGDELRAIADPEREQGAQQRGRAPGRESGCQYVKISVVEVYLNKKKHTVNKQTDDKNQNDNRQEKI